MSRASTTILRRRKCADTVDYRKQHVDTNGSAIAQQVIWKKESAWQSFFAVLAVTKPTPTCARLAHSSNNRLANQTSGRWHSLCASSGTTTTGRSYHTPPKGPVPTRSAYSGIPAQAKLPLLVGNEHPQ
ncbi:MAG: hypothetical protein J07HX5_00742 [halophilic archaeon J07HX5]|nr:MAG: hypothetical protein J07HX5_00742 [halophilic archaeon J07HX5]